MNMQQFGAALWKCWRETTVAYNAFAKKEGVESSELWVVDALWDEAHGLTQREICEYADMNKQTVSAVCKRLISRGHLASAPSKADGRARLVSLTAAGQSAWRGPVERMRQLEERAMESIPPEDALVFLRVSQQYAKAFAKEVGHDGNGNAGA